MGWQQKRSPQKLEYLGSGKPFGRWRGLLINVLFRVNLPLFGQERDEKGLEVQCLALLAV